MRIWRKNSMYSKILLVWLVWDQASASCWIFWIITQYLYLPKFLQLIICYWSYTNAVQLTRGMFDLYISFLCWFKVNLYVFCVTEKVYGLGDKGSEDNYNSCCTDTVGGLFKHAPEIGLFHWWSFFLVKSETFDLGTTALGCWIIRILKLLDVRGTDFFLCMKLSGIM